MIHVAPIRHLTLRAPAAVGRPAHVSAASGLVCAGDFRYVVADDELQLGVFAAHGDEPGELARVFPGELPDAAAPRKARKPDLEALVRLPPFGRYACGALLALGSGSAPNRSRGALLPLDARGALAGAARSIDLAGSYGPRAKQIHTLNIEGAAVLGDALVLLQRGNRHDPRSALIRLSLRETLVALASAESLAISAAGDMVAYDLGTIDAAPLCFSDGAALPDGRLVFAAIAEAADDSVQDGPCNGAAVGIIDCNGGLQLLERIEPTYKIEGIDARMDGSRIELSLVTDADDPTIAALLLRATLKDPLR